MLYNGEYERLSSLEAHIRHHQISCYRTRPGFSTNTDYSNLGESCVLQPNEGILFTRPIQAKDQHWPGLYPRVELVPKKQKIPKKKTFQLEYEISTVGVGYYAIILQLMVKNLRFYVSNIFQDHEPNGTALPTFQLALRHGELQYRMTEILPDGTRGYMKYVSVCGIYEIPKLLTVRGYLSSNPSKSWITLNGKQVEIPTCTASTYPDGVQVQFGLYGDEQRHMELLVRRLMYFIEDSEEEETKEQVRFYTLGPYEVEITDEVLTRVSYILKGSRTYLPLKSNDLKK